MIGAANLREVRGLGRLLLGDPGGIDDQRASAEALAAEDDLHSVYAYGNLGDSLRGFGMMGQSTDAWQTADQLAHRFDDPIALSWIATERALQSYHAADWDSATNHLAPADSTSPIDDSAVRVTRGRIQCSPEEPPRRH